jgi:hypothetical protein
MPRPDEPFHYIVIRPKGDHEPCDGCGHAIEIFTEEGAHARFLMVRLADHPSLGGGTCPKCRKRTCIACAIKTVYGSGIRRLHCPGCGSFLAGLRRTADDAQRTGAFLDEPPEFSGPPEHAPEA